MMMEKAPAKGKVGKMTKHSAKLLSLAQRPKTTVTEAVEKIPINSEVAF